MSGFCGKGYFGLFLSYALGGYCLDYGLVLPFLQTIMKSRILLHLQQNSHYIEIGLKQQGISYLSHINTAYRVSLIDSHGKVVYDNLALKESLDNHAERIEFKESMQNGVAQSYRYSQSMQQEMLYHAVKIMLEKRLIESSVSLETSSNFSRNCQFYPNKPRKQIHKF